MNTKADWTLSQAVLLLFVLMPGASAPGQPVPGLPSVSGMAGVKAVRVATGDLIRQPTSLAFADDGTLYVLEHRPGAVSTTIDELPAPGSGAKLPWFRSTKASRDLLWSLHDANGDGLYDEARPLMDDLESPSSLLVDSGWIYWTSRGRILRRRAFDAELLEQSRADADAQRGPATVVTPDVKWIEQELIHGLAALEPFHASHLTLGPDGCLYIACGSGTSIAQSWDDTSAIVVRSGAVFRTRRDGSAIVEHCRGLVSPIALAFDALGQLLVLDSIAPREDAGCRLIQALEGADYGWRHARPASDSAEAYAAALAKPDPILAGTSNPRPGTLPATGELRTLAAVQAVLCQGAGFPESIQGAFIVSSAKPSQVSLIGLEREEGLTRPGETRVLFGGDDFHPQHVVQGPDGAIYVLSRGKEGGEIWRLSWGGTAESPAIPLKPLDVLAGLQNQSDAELMDGLQSKEAAIRRAASAEIAVRASESEERRTSIRAGLLAALEDESKDAEVRAAVMLAAGQLPNEAVVKAMFKPLAGQHTDLQRLAAELLGRNPPEGEELLAEAAQQVQFAAGQARDPLLGRALRLALGRLAAKGEPTSSDWSFEATSVIFGAKLDPYLFDGHVRALEAAPGAAKELMLGNLDVAINFPVTEFAERQRIKEFVVTTAAAMRTRELAEFLDALLRGKDDYLGKMEAPLEVRLISAYQNVVVLPPINADAIAEWIEGHPGGPVEVELAALETLSIVGTTKANAIDKLASSLLAKPDGAAAVAKSLLAAKLGEQLAPQVLVALRQHAAESPTPELQQLINQIERLPAP